jgi:hypothetical protein
MSRCRYGWSRSPVSVPDAGVYYVPLLKPELSILCHASDDQCHSPASLISTIEAGDKPSSKQADVTSLKQLIWATGQICQAGNQCSNSAVWSPIDQMVGKTWQRLLIRPAARRFIWRRFTSCEVKNLGKMVFTYWPCPVQSDLI